MGCCVITKMPEKADLDKPDLRVVLFSKKRSGARTFLSATVRNRTKGARTFLSNATRI